MVQVLGISVFYRIEGGGVKSEKYWCKVSLIPLQICGDGDVVHSTKHGYNEINWCHILISTIKYKSRNEFIEFV